MELKYQKEINLIKNCPVDNHKGEKVLFRCVESSLSSDSFLPQAVLLKPKYQNLCIAWGLSLFTDYKVAKNTLNNLSKNKRINYSKIAKSTLTEKDGVKHCTKNQVHYTFFPEKNLDLLSKFSIVDDK